MAPEFNNVADFQDPGDPQGRTYRQVNAAKTHAVPLGALVELKSGERMFVKRHTRDCDLTPLYSIGMKNDDVDSGLMCQWHHGYADDDLTVVKCDDGESATKGEHQ